MSEKPKIYFENLDGLRFVCFLSVFFFHSFHTNHEYIRSDPSYAFIKYQLFGNGNLGVNFFFVLSGFLITFLLLKEHELFGKIDVIAFWKRRMLRIWPLFYFCVFFGFIIFPFLKSYFGQTPNESARPVYYLLFINNFDFIEKGPPDASVLGVLWSLAIEEQFYLVWPLLLFLIPARFYRLLFPALMVFAAIFRYYNLRNHAVIEMSTFSCAGDLMMGATGALVIKNKDFLKWITTMSKSLIALIYAAALAVFFFRSEIYRSLDVLAIFERDIISFIFLLIILEQCYAEKSFYKMKNLRFFSRMGTISYGLYCLHFIGILIATTLTTFLGWNVALWQVVFLDTFVALSISILVSSVSYKYYEGPFLNVGRRLSKFA